MNRIAIILLLSVSLTMTARAQSLKKVLFLGNSYTYVNDLPGLIAQVAHSMGDSLRHSQSTPGGYTFQMHCQNPITQPLIDESDWDYVVLQEQSQLPSWPPDSVQLLVYPYADTLNMWVKQHDSCTTTLFFMTWGRQNGDADNCPWYPQVCTYTGMQARLRQSYLEMGTLFSAEVSPVGIAWENTRSLFPAIELYIQDGSHPSIYGSYLAACTFYGVLFHKSPVGAIYPAAIPSDTANLLQQIAFHTVFDSLSVWYIDTTRVHAGFTFASLGGESYQFTNTSLNAVQYLWDFGDQTYSQAPNPAHTYAASGNFLVTLYAEKDCDTSSKQQLLTVVSVSASSTASTAVLFPNPAKDFIRLENIKQIESYSLMDLSGRILLTGKETVIDIRKLEAGNYFLRVSTRAGASTFRVIKIRE